MGSRKKHSNRKPIVIGVSLPTLREVRWVRDKEGMESAVKSAMEYVQPRVNTGE